MTAPPSGCGCRWTPRRWAWGGGAGRQRPPAPHCALPRPRVPHPVSPQGSAVFDFSGSGHEVYGNCNAPRAITLSALIYCLRCMVGQDIPLNQVGTGTPSVGAPGHVGTPEHRYPWCGDTWSHRDPRAQGPLGWPQERGRALGDEGRWGRGSWDLVSWGRSFLGSCSVGLGVHPQLRPCPPRAAWPPCASSSPRAPSWTPHPRPQWWGATC